MKRSPKASAVNRRAFLRGSGAVAIGLPFLESLPLRSAWSGSDSPVFSLFVSTACGVVPTSFWPTQLGSLAGLADDTTQATSVLGDYADRLLMIRNVRYEGFTSACSHGEAMPQVLTGLPPVGSDIRSAASGPSADVVIAASVNPVGVEPLTLYSGMQGGYIDERLSFTSEGLVREAEGSPYVVYQNLLQAMGMLAGATQPASPELIDDILLRRQSVVDFVREDLTTLVGRTSISVGDRRRLEMHLGSLREFEQATMGMMEEDMGAGGCSSSLLDGAGIEAAQENFRSNGQIETVAKLQMELAAFAFACNVNRTATLQQGDGTDSTRYDVPSNERGWSFHHVSHRIQSDGSRGNDALAEAAHAEIDRLRLETLRHGIERFDAYGLLDSSFIYWTNHHADGFGHTFRDLPIIIAGSGGGRIRQGEHIDADDLLNSAVLGHLIDVAGGDSTDFALGGTFEDMLVG